MKEHFRENTWDKDIFRCVYELNEYKVNNFNKLIVLDIGGHIGSFSKLATDKGARMVKYYEPFKDNFEIGSKLLPWSVEKINSAVWYKNEELSFDKCSDPINTGGGAISSNGIKVSSVVFDEELKKIKVPFWSKSKILVKFDCEGSEFPILLTSKELHKVDFICGEFHEMREVPEIFSVKGKKSYSAMDLQIHLKISGFEYLYFERSKDSKGNPVPLGHFWASRTPEHIFDLTLIEDSIFV